MRGRIGGMNDKTTQAYLRVLERAITSVRCHAAGNRRFSDDHLYELMDAIHLVPEFLGGTGVLTDELMRDMLGSYSGKWAKNGGMDLIGILDDSMSD